MTTSPNAEQRARWNGPSGSAWSEYAEHFERGYADFDAAYLDAVPAFTALGQATRPGGRLVLLTWQGPERNPWQVEVLRALHPDREAPIPPTDGPSPFGLSDAARVRSVLGAAGFVDVDLEDLRAPHWSGADPDDAVRFTATHHAAVLDGYDDATRRRALEPLRELFEAHHTPDGVLFDSATWLVRARRP